MRAPMPRSASMARSVNNVNARAFMLEPRYIAKLKRLADAWRPYGIRVYLSARFSAPRDIGGLDNRRSARSRSARLVAGQGGRDLRRNPRLRWLSGQGQQRRPARPAGLRPHPCRWRQHAGRALWAIAGTVIWRAFVYSAEDETDRAKQAYAEFVPLDGQFADNVIVQVKNGPIDFQPREPFHPMFGAMPDTRLMLEVQITKEYLGFASHLAFLAPMWKEALDAETGRMGSVAQVVAPAGMAGVANTGSDRNWTGSHFDQANWYAFGRLAWDPALSSETIAREWASQTFTPDSGSVDQISDMMLGSRETVARYMTPMGLAHLMDTGHHYGPGPWVCDLPQARMEPVLLSPRRQAGHRLRQDSNGFGCLVAIRPRNCSAVDAIRRASIRASYCGFTRVGWNDRMASGKTVWEELVARYDLRCGRGRCDGVCHGRAWSRRSTRAVFGMSVKASLSSNRRRAGGAMPRSPIGNLFNSCRCPRRHSRSRSTLERVSRPDISRGARAMMSLADIATMALWPQP